MKSCEKEQANKGFTLVELIVVIAVLSVLAGILTLNIIRYIENGREAIDINNAALIRDALFEYPYPSDFQGRDVWYTDPVTKESEHYERGWVYVDKTEIRCSDQSTALAMIMAGLVHVSDYTYEQILNNEEQSTRWFPSGPDGDFIRRSDIDEYVFHNNLTVKARKAWNTYQLDVYVDDAGYLHMGASASNTLRKEGHEKDAKTATAFAKKLGFDGALTTPIGAQYGGN